MQKFLLAIVALLLIGACSCNDIAKKTAEKATEISLSAVEGVANAIEKHGEKTAEKVTDAAGTVAMGVGKSLDKQLNEHASTVASVAGRTLVQTVDGLDKGVMQEYYDQNTSYHASFCPGVNLELFGKIKDRPIIDAYFTAQEGSYAFSFDFYSDAGCKTLSMRKSSSATVESGTRGHTVVSFALNDEEEANYSNAKCIKISATKK